MPIFDLSAGVKGQHRSGAAPQLRGYKDLLDEVLAGALDSGADTDRGQRSLELIKACAVASAATCVQPTPHLDVALFNPIQIDLVRGLGRLSGQKVDKGSASRVLSSIGASLVEQASMLEGGDHEGSWVAPASTAYALTWAVGEAAQAHFSSGGGSEELRAIFESAFERIRSQKQAERGGDERLHDRLQQVTEAYEADLLSEEEYGRMKERVLVEF